MRLMDLLCRDQESVLRRDRQHRQERVVGVLANQVDASRSGRAAAMKLWSHDLPDDTTPGWL